MPREFVWSPLNQEHYFVDIFDNFNEYFIVFLLIQ